MRDLEKRVERLEAASSLSWVNRPVVIAQDGESDDEAFARIGVPVELRGSGLVIRFRGIGPTPSHTPTTED